MSYRSTAVGVGGEGRMDIPILGSIAACCTAYILRRLLQPNHSGCSYDAAGHVAWNGVATVSASFVSTHMRYLRVAINRINCQESMSLQRGGFSAGSLSPEPTSRSALDWILTDLRTKTVDTISDLGRGCPSSDKAVFR